MTHLRYRSTKANQGSTPSRKTRAALGRRILIDTVKGKYTQEQGRSFFILAQQGYIDKKAVYGYHPTKRSA